MPSLVLHQHTSPKCRDFSSADVVLQHAKSSARFKFDVTDLVAEPICSFPIPELTSCTHMCEHLNDLIKSSNSEGG
jgi:hypothetical protein